MKIENLSIYYITKNEALRLPMSLEVTTTLSDDIVVVDSGSTDATVQIAAKYGARVVHRDWEGFAVQKAYAAELCKHHWVLEVDADEVPSHALMASLRRLFESPDVLSAHAGYEICWEHVAPFPGHPMKYAQPLWIMRLYDRRRAGIRAQAYTIDDRARVHTGTVGRLSGTMLHRPVLSLEQMERKFFTLSSDQAQEYVAKNRHISNIRLFTELPFKFLKLYFLRGNYRNGWYGYCVAVVGAYRSFMRLAKARDMQLVKHSHGIEK